MKRLIQKIALFMIALSLILLIAPAAANPIPTTPWEQERLSIFEWVLYGGRYHGADEVVYYPDSEVVVVTEFRFQDLITDARTNARTRLSSFISSGLHWG